MNLLKIKDMTAGCKCSRPVLLRENMQKADNTEIN